MEPPVPVLAIPADLTALSIGTAGLASAQKTTGKNNVHGKKKYHTRFVQHQPDRLESLYFL